MAEDIERSFKGTTFAVATLVVLLVLVGIYLVASHAQDGVDDTRATAPASSIDAPDASASPQQQ